MAYLIEELKVLGVDSHVAARKNSAFEKKLRDKSLSGRGKVIRSRIVWFFGPIH